MLEKDSAIAAEDVGAVMARLGRSARQAARAMAQASTSVKNAALQAMAEAIETDCDTILAANALDMEAANKAGNTPAFLDRLKLDESRVAAMAEGVREVAALADPVGSVIAEWDRPNGLHIARVRTPLGVIGIIFESRPNVSADAGALCLKAGNVAILRGGSDSWHSVRAIHACLARGLVSAGLPTEAIQIVPTTDRAAVGEMLAGLRGNLDVIVPRGGRSLVERVQTEARVPVFAHLEGVCHVYVDASAEVEMAVDITVNSKMRRTGICGSAETLLVDRAAKDTHLLPILVALAKTGCTIRATDEVRALYPVAKPATEEDWPMEYLAPIIAVKLVDGVDEAIEHIETWGSHHTEAVVAENEMVVEKFFEGIDSAILLHNASTQYADGGEFGMGAEIGIATGKMHARGPVGVEQLTSFNYRVRGNGQTRP
ncbi:MAG: glutamate-5-semialdehyde dehydrogenase [Salaquimonas sp.]|nr:glutamate-5-semialdehyde dehydrogenase [Salaquimonas sp.]